MKASKFMDARKAFINGVRYVGDTLTEVLDR